MGLLGVIKAFLSSLGAFFGFLDRRATRRDAKAAVYGEQDRETLELVKRVNAIVPDSELNRVWGQLQKDRRKRSVPDNPGP